MTINTIRPKNSLGNLYLSGGMQFAESLGGAWREELSAQLKDINFTPLNITDMDAFFEKKHPDVKLLPSKNNKDVDINIYRQLFREHFIEPDTKLITEQTDAVIVLYDESARKGAGTTSEVMHAYNQDIPIFMVCLDYKSEEEVFLNTSAFFTGMVTKIFTNFNDLTSYLSNLPPKILIPDNYGNRRFEDQYLCSLTGNVFQSETIYTKKISKLTSPALLEKVDNLIINKTPVKNINRYNVFENYIEKQADEINQKRYNEAKQNLKNMR